MKIGNGHFAFVVSISALVFLTIAFSPQSEVFAQTSTKSDDIKKVPIAVTIFPGFSSTGKYGHKVEPSFALNLVGRYSRLNGAEFGYFANWELEYVDGAQFAGFANVVEGWVDGAQFAGMVNYAKGDQRWLAMAGFTNYSGGNTEGAQLAGLVNYSAIDQSTLAAAGMVNFSGGLSEGVQLAGLINYAARDQKWIALSGLGNYSGGNVTGFTATTLLNYVDGSFKGIQAAYGFNIVRNNLEGLQVSGVVNYSGKMGTGIQWGSINYAHQLEGIQLSVLNIGGSLNGIQCGVVNIARNVIGTQIGVVNICRDIRGAPIGLVSYVHSNPLRFDLWASETGQPHIAVRYGAPRVYGLASVGANWLEDSAHYFYGIGIGYHHPFVEHYLEIDLISYYVDNVDVDNEETSILNKLRCTYGIPIKERLDVFAGFTLNSFISGVEKPGDFALWASDERLNDEEDVDGIFIWPGFILGVRF